MGRCRRSRLPSGPLSFTRPLNGVPSGLAVRFNVPSALAGATTDDLRVAGSTVARRCGYSSHIRFDRPNRAPLLRFGSLQRLPAAWRYPVLPALGRSRCAVCIDFSLAPEASVSGIAWSQVSSALRFFAKHPTRDAADCGSCVALLSVATFRYPRVAGVRGSAGTLSPSRQRSWG